MNHQTNNTTIMRWFIALTLTSFASKFIYLTIASKTPFFLPLTLDPLSYTKTAMSTMYNGHGLPIAVFYQAPLYVYYLIFGNVIFNHNLFLVRSLQVLIASFVPSILFALADKVFTRSIAIITGISLIFYGPIVYEDALGDKTSLAIALFVLAILVTNLAITNDKYWLLGGVLWGTCALIRENTLIVGIILIVVYAKKKIPYALLGISIVVCLPFLLNLKNGDTVLITSQSGQNFYIGNNVGATGSYHAPPFVRPDPEYEQYDFMREAERKLHKQLKPSQASNYWLKEGMNFILHNPLKTLKLWVKKILMLFNFYEIPDNYNYAFIRQKIPFLRLFFFDFGIIGPLALYGILHCVKNIKKNRNLAMLYITAGAYAVTLIAFFVVGRYRIMICPLFVPFAVWAVFDITSKIHSKNLRKIVTSASVLLITTFMIHQRLYGYQIPRNYYKEYYMLGHTYKEMHEYAKAIDAWEETLALNPNFNDAYRSIQCAKNYLCRDSLIIALDCNPKNVDLCMDLAENFQNTGEDSQALALFIKAVELDNEQYKAWGKIGLLEATVNSNYVKGIMAFNRALAVDSLNAVYWANLGNCFYMTHDTILAIRFWKKALSIDSTSELLKHNVYLLGKTKPH